MHTSTPAIADITTTPRRHALAGVAPAPERRPPRRARPLRVGARVGRDHAPLRAPAARATARASWAPSRAEDAVQQTFLQAFLALRDGSDREIALRAWLYRIAHNCSIDLLRKGSPDYEQLDLEYDGVAQPPTLFEQREEIRRPRRPHAGPARGAAPGARAARARGPQLRGDLRAARALGLGRAPADLPGAHGAAQRRGGGPAARAAEDTAVPAACTSNVTTWRPPSPCRRRPGAGVDAVSAATLAVVAVLGGGLAASDGSSRQGAARSTPERTPAPSPPRIAAPAMGRSRTGSGLRCSAARTFRAARRRR